VEQLQQSSDSSLTASNATSSTISSTKSRSSNQGLSIQDSGKIYYNAGQLFDALDKDKNAKLDFDELQHVLELNPEQLQAFVSRMNELGGQSNNATHISRSVFVKHFLRVLEETSNFGPTQAEIEDLFDELAHGNDVATYLDFFDSRLSLFLSDPQINKMIAEFRTCALLEDGAKNRPRSSIRRQRNSAEVAEHQVGSSLVMAEEGTRRSRDANHRPSLRPSSSSKKFSMVNLFAPQDAARRVIHRDVFCKYYAEVLSRVTQDSKADADNGDSVTKARGVDLAFEDLSLAVAVGDKEVNVVNSVSGRLPASTMTALMGGSGKCHTGKEQKRPFFVVSTFWSCRCWQDLVAQCIVWKSLLRYNERYHSHQWTCYYD
jgi:Ca2+-binding EF-hand superfamily protein